MYIPKNIPTFYLLRPCGAIAVSGHIFVRLLGNHSSVVFCPEEGVTECIYNGSDSDVMRFHRQLLDEMSYLPNTYFPVIDMRDFKNSPSIDKDIPLPPALVVKVNLYHNGHQDEEEFGSVKEAAKFAWYSTLADTAYIESIEESGVVVWGKGSCDSSDARLRELAGIEEDD